MKKVVVFGAGPVGRRTAALFSADEFDVTIVSRSGTKVPGVEAVAADACDSAATDSICEGSDIILNCLNPAYHRWSIDWPPMALNLLRAAEANQAVLATTSNLYVYGPTSSPMKATSALAGTGDKARVRVDMWNQALAAHQAGRTRAVEVRGSDYVGAGSQSHLGERVVPKVLAGKPVRVVGSPEQLHSWTYVGDVAQTLKVAATSSNAWGRAWHVPSHPARTQRDMIGIFARTLGVDPVPVRGIGRATIRAGGIISPMLREIGEVYYQFDQPFVMDDAETRIEFGLAPTNFDDIVLDHLSDFVPAVDRAAGHSNYPAEPSLRAT